MNRVFATHAHLAERTAERGTAWASLFAGAIIERTTDGVWFNQELAEAAKQKHTQAIAPPPQNRSAAKPAEAPWGPAMWAEIHSKNDADLDYVNRLITRLGQHRTCTCQPDAAEYIKAHPPVFGEGWFEWTVRFHNHVNDKLSKPTLSIDNARLRWLSESTPADEVKRIIAAPASSLHCNPPKWELWPNVQQAHRQAFEDFRKTIEPYAPGDGRGIVICAGGKFFDSAYITIRVLRHVGCNLPIQLWYLGRKNEKQPWMERATATENVSWINADEVARRHPCRILNGWELKAFAVLRCGFAEVLSLDADSYPTKNPEYLFDDPAYRQHGAMFFPDNEPEDVHRWARTRSLPDYRTLFGLPPVHEPAIESGQFLVNRQTCGQELNLAWWLNDHSDYFYKVAYGDKETYHLAWRYTGRQYAMPAKRWHRNNPSGLSTWAHTMQQHDMQGEAIFYHRVGGKLCLDPQRFMTPQNWAGVRNNNLLHEEFVWQVLDELRAIRDHA